MDEQDRLVFERNLWEQGFSRVMGLDEVGRGCLAGPVVAAGVILKPGVSHPVLRDSKKLSRVMRESLRDWIKQNAVFWHIEAADPEEIDRINILKASLASMWRCVESAGAAPDYLLVDGNRFVQCLIPHQCIVKGDDRSASIAAASILAKTYRDDLMQTYHTQYPVYGWDRNVGYPTTAHYLGLAEYGYTPLHRRSFRLRTEKLWMELEERPDVLNGTENDTSNPSQPA